MSLFERIQNKRYDLQEKKKRYQKKVDHGFGDDSGKKTGGFEDITGEGIKKGDYPKTRKELEAKRKEYGINKDGVPSKEGIKRYAEKTKQLQSGSNQPVKITQKDLNVAKERMVGGKPVKNKAGQVIGKTTGKYGGTLNPLATKAERTATKKAIEMSKTINAKPLPKVYDAKASKELGTDVFRRIKKTLPRTQKTKVIDTPTRRVQLLKPPKIKTIRKAPPIISDPVKTTNPLKTLTKTELEKLTAPKGFVKTKTGSFTKTKPLFKNMTKRLSKMGRPGKVAAGLLALTGIGVGLSKTGQKQDNKKLLVPPTTSKTKKPIDFSISLGPGK